ncbi:DUF2141 domain-containing protein [bacterium]|nr:DUF2141 domain-containing protein [bacterium]
MKKLVLLPLLLIVLYLGSTLLFAESEKAAGTMTVSISNLKNTRGFIMLALCSNEDQYTEDSVKPFRTIRQKIKGNVEIIILEDIPFGTYAIKVFHDENSNKKLDRNFLKIPKEGYGFSNNTKGKAGALKFEKACFSFNSASADIEIKLKN